MKRRSPFSVSYQDLVDQAEKSLQLHQAAYNAAAGRATVNLDTLTHQVEVAKTLLRMLRKGVKEKQTDFYELFEQVKK